MSKTKEEARIQIVSENETSKKRLSQSKSKSLSHGSGGGVVRSYSRFDLEARPDVGGYSE